MLSLRAVTHSLAASVLVRDDPASILLGQLAGWKLPRSVASRNLNMVLGRYEKPIQGVIRNHVAPGQCAYDIGANVGFFTLLFASLVGNLGTVHAFEPSTPEADSAEGLVRCNDIGGFTHVHRTAVSNATGVSTLLSSGLTGILLDAPRNDGQYTGSSASSVRTTTLDDFVFGRGNAPPDFMKVDVESAEAMVLAGAPRVLSETRPRMLIEVHGRTAARDVLACLIRARYDCFHIRDASRTVLHSPDDLHAIFRPGVGTAHVLALPRGA